MGLGSIVGILWVRSFGVWVSVGLGGLFGVGVGGEPSVARRAASARG